MSSIDRFNKYKSLCENAASFCVRTFLHIVRPAEGFSYFSNFDIHRAWLEWKDAEEVFYRMTGHGVGWGEAPNRVFPAPPPEDAEHLPCRQMWGCLVQEQVERQDFQAPSIKAAVTAILASDACKSHPASCPCKVPNNPWTWHECVAELEPLCLQHNPKCQCGGWQTCKQKVAAAEVERARLANMMTSAIQKAQAELAEKPWLNVGDCICDAQYCAVSCSCLPGRVVKANAESARMAAAAKAASERASAEVAEWRAETEVAEWRARCMQDARGQLDAKPALNEHLAPCYCKEVSCICLPGRVHRAKEALKDKAAEAVGAGLEAAKKGEATPLLSLFRSRAPEPVATAEPVAAPVTALITHPKGFVPWTSMSAPSPPPTLPTPLSRQSSYDYQHHVDTCPCGTCHKARVDSGTADQYMKRCKRDTDLALKRATCPGCKATEKVSGRNICMECYVEKNAYDSRGFLKMPTELHMMRQAYVLEEASWIATKEARDELALTAQMPGCGGADVNSSDLAKDIFAALGTPHNSNCPHGIPFYACMPCSH